MIQKCISDLLFPHSDFSYSFFFLDQYGIVFAVYSTISLQSPLKPLLRLNISKISKTIFQNPE